MRDLSNDQNQVAGIINSWIKERFSISSFEPGEIEAFIWYEVKCSTEIKEDILYISFAGEHYGAYLNTVAEEVFFDLKTGQELETESISFEALFTLSGYLEFLRKYWLEGVKREFETAVKCAGSEPDWRLLRYRKLQRRE